MSVTDSCSDTIKLTIAQVSDALLKLEKPAAGRPAKAGYLADIGK